MSVVPLLDMPPSPAPLAPSAGVLSVGDHAPDVELRLGPHRGSLHRWADDAWVVVFALHDGDALERAAELRRLAALLPDFRARCVKLLGIASPAALDPDDNAPSIPVSFDHDGETARRYGLTAAARNVAVIDPAHRLRLLLGYPPRRPRDFADVLRLITALQQADARGRAGRSDWRAVQAATFGAW